MTDVEEQVVTTYWHAHGSDGEEYGNAMYTRSQLGTSRQGMLLVSYGNLVDSLNKIYKNGTYLFNITVGYGPMPGKADTE